MSINKVKIFKENVSILQNYSKQLINVFDFIKNRVT